MGDVKEIGGGWKAMEVPGRGVLVQAEMGLIFVEGVKVEDDSLVGDPDFMLNIVPAAAAPARPAKAGPSSISSVNVKAFLDETDRKNLTSGGEYGPIGPVLGKLREVLRGCEPDSDVSIALGELLETGNHDKYRTAAAVIGMDAKTLDEFVQVLGSPEVDIVEAFVERVINAQPEAAAPAAIGSFSGAEKKILAAAGATA